MSFLSYAQNFEDVMLWRALKHVPNGRYVDIGAQHPIVDSVSKAFYEAGWRGIHVEPVPEYVDLLRQDRPDEVVLQAALSDRPGVLELNIFPDTGLSTGVKEFAERHEAGHGLRFERVQVPMLPMRDAFASLAGQEVHWLKIDVEGMEEAVLRGWDSQALRPWIIVVESTIPMSADVNYEGFDHIITEAGYRFCYFDGLNRFYTANEHADLASHFEIPPNVFDEVRLSGLANSELCREVLEQKQQQRGEFEHQVAEREAQLRVVRADAERRLTAADAVRDALQTEHDALQAEHRILQAEHGALQVELSQSQHIAEQSQALAAARQQHLDALLGSTSWRLSAPVRIIGAPIGRLTSAVRDNRLRSGIKRRIKTVLWAGANKLAGWPRLHWATVKLLRLNPALSRQIRAVGADPAHHVGNPHPELSQAAREVLVALQACARAPTRG